MRLAGAIAFRRRDCIGKGDSRSSPLAQLAFFGCAVAAPKAKVSCGWVAPSMQLPTTRQDRQITDWKTVSALDE